MNFTEVVESRQSVREYVPGVELPEQDLQMIIEMAAKAPSSWNLQHWKFLVIQKSENKQKLLPIAYNQKQVVYSSAVIAVLGDLQADKNVESIYGEAVKHGFMAEEVKNTLEQQIQNAYQSEQFAQQEAVLNSSLAAMQLMLAAKKLGYDTCPMGGFDRNKFVETFNVPDRYTPVMLITVGKAAKQAHGSSRLSNEAIIVNEMF